MARYNLRILALTGLLMSLGALPAHAQTARSGGGGNALLMQQMQQLASERTSLQAENAKLKKDLEDLRKDRDALKTQQQVLDRRAKTSELSLKQVMEHRGSSDQELAQMKEKTQQLVAKFKETLGNLREIETRNTATQQTLATREHELKSCVDHNTALYALNQEVLTRLEHQSMWSRVAQTEPFTRIKRVQLENLVDEYKSRADEQRVATPAAPAAAQQPDPAPAK